MTGQERESQLSAMFDGELPQEECELLARRLSRDEDLRRSYAHYALIGSVIRNEPMASQAFAAKVHGALRGTVTAVPSTAVSSLEGGGAIPGTQASGTQASGSQTSDSVGTPASRRWAWPLGAVGLAASVAAIALLGLDPAVIRGSGVGGGVPAIAQTESADGRGGTSLGDVAIVEEVVTSAVSSDLVAEVIIPARPASLEPESYVTPPVEGRADRRLAPAVQLANFVVAHGTVSVPMMRHSALSAFITDAESASGALGPEAVTRAPADGAAQ